jgi:hypothetical protein
MVDPEIERPTLALIDVVPGVTAVATAPTFVATEGLLDVHCARLVTSSTLPSE